MIMKKLLIALLAVAGVITGGFLYTSAPSTLNIGAELPQAPALFETSLAAPITANATEMTLVSNSIRGGGTLSGYNCFTIDEGSAQAEFVCGNASGTVVTNLVRGISPSDGISEVAALKFPHRRGASVKITDFPIIQLLRAQNNGDATFENVLRYAGDVVPSGASDLADVGYVLSVVNGGSVDFDALVVAGRAGETVATGTLVYFARADQEWYRVNVNSTTTWQGRSIGITQGAGTNGTNIGGGGVLLMGRSTVNTGLTAGAIYYASTSGAIATTSSVLAVGEAESASVLYFDPSQYNMVGSAWNNTFSGNNTFNGTTTFNGTIVGATRVDIYTSNATWTKPTTARSVEVIVIGAGGGGGSGSVRTANPGTGGGGGGGGGISVAKFSPSDVPSSVAVTVGTGGTGGAAVTASANTIGNDGTAGGSSSFGTLLVANGGSAGGGGSASAGGNSGAGGTGFTLNGLAGSGGGSSGAAGAAANSTTGQCTGGGGGGGSTLDPFVFSGGAAGSITTFITRNGGTAGTAGNNGGAGTTINGGTDTGGTGGGGGGSASDSTAGNGGAAGICGGGGGGGSQMRLSGTRTSGSGGSGGNGLVFVITY